jgi:hypothetical protein
VFDEVNALHDTMQKQLGITMAVKSEHSKGPADILGEILAEKVNQPTSKSPTSSNPNIRPEHTRLVDGTDEFIAKGFGGIGIVGAGRPPKK